MRPRRLTVRDLLAEALAGVAARPSRLVLTVLGTVLGIAALVSTLGLGQTAAGQIAERFDAVAATRVTVTAGQRQGPDGDVAKTQLPWDAADRVKRLAGVTESGIYGRVDVDKALVRGVALTDPSGTGAYELPVAAASTGLFRALKAELATGRLFDEGHDRRADPVVVLGHYAAERLGVTGVAAQPSIFIGDRPFAVLGIIQKVTNRAELLDAVIMPVGTARATYALVAPDVVEIRTRVGAPRLVGSQAAIALSPADPELLQTTVPPPPSKTRQHISTDVNLLFLALGGVALLVGGLGIANVTLLSVLERVPEIGLRRAVGAGRGHIAGQFLVESVVVGFLGGLIGATAGILTTVGVSAARDWTPLLDARLAVYAPLLGAAIGLVAGTYPAWRAARIEPIAALRAS